MLKKKQTKKPLQFFLFPISLKFLGYNLFFYQRIGASALDFGKLEVSIYTKAEWKVLPGIYMEKKMPVLCDVI